MKRKPVLAGLILLLSVLLTLAWLWSSQLVGLLVRGYLQELGFDNVTIRIESVSYKGLRIERLSFARSTGNPQRVDIFDAELSFSLGKLAVGKLRGLRIHEAIIETGIAQESPGFDLGQALTFLVRPWSQDWPLKSLSVRRVTIHRAPSNFSQRLSLNLRHVKTRLVGRIGLWHATDNRRYIDLSLSPRGELRVMLRTLTKNAALPMSIDLSVQESTSQRHVWGRIEANLQPLCQWLKPWLVPGSLSMVRGGHAEIEFSLTQGVAGSAELRSRIVVASRLEALVIDTTVGHPLGKQSVAGLGQSSAQPLVIKATDTVGFLAPLLPRMLRIAAATLKVEADVEQRPKRGEVVIGFRSDGQVRSLQAHPVTLDNVAIHLPGTLSRDARTTKLVIDPEATVMLDALVYPPVRVPLVRITATASQSNSRTVSLEGLWGSTRIGLPAHWQVAPPRLRTEQFRIQGESVEVVLRELAWRRANRLPVVSGRITTTNLLLEMSNKAFPCQHADMNFVISGDALRAKFELSLAEGAGRLHGELRQPFGAGRGRVTFVLDALDFEEKRTPLSHFLSEWPYAFDLVAGKLALFGEFSWPQPTSGRGPNANTGTLGIKLSDGGGFYQAVWFSGLDTDIVFRLDPKVRTARSAQVKVSALDFGLPLRDVELTFALLRSERGPLPRLVAYGLKAALLGGELESRRLEIDANSVVQHVPLRLSQLDLAELIALYPFSGLQATGRLAGMMEVKVSQAGISVQDGMLYALAPGGRIRYRPSRSPGDAEATIPGSAALFRALEDFRYEVLRAKADYAENGELLLKLHLEGKSPRLQRNRAVHINLNLEQNVLSLLRSLRLVNGLNERLDTRVRAHYEEAKKRPRRGSRILP